MNGGYDMGGSATASGFVNVAETKCGIFEFEETPMETETAEHLEQSQHVTMNFALTEMEVAVLRETVEVSKEADPLDKVLDDRKMLKKLAGKMYRI
ncbi:hypothetical protein QYF36_005083 [Acer negundo]|nr:hypothetical protein QYF36_005083 [Acer negundo]